MPIERYFQQIRELIARSRRVQNAAVEYDRRDKNTGFLRGNITFVNGSILHVREFTNVSPGLHRLSYSYQYMDPAKQLIFRYDDADHHRELNLPTHPHHKHDGDESNIIAATAPTLADVLAEIEQLL